MTAPDGKAPGEGDRLRAMLQRRARAVGEQTAETGEVSREQLDDLERLARLVAISDAAQRPRAARRWPLVAGLGFTLLIVSVLLFARTRETEIELDLDLSEASFVSSRLQILADAIGVTSLGVAGLREIQIPRARDRGAETLTAAGAEPELGFRLSVGEGARPGTVALAALSLPAGTRVWLRSADTPRQYRLSLRGPDLRLRAEVSGVVNVGTSGTATGPVDFGAPKAVLLQPGSSGVDIDVALLDGARAAFSPQLRAEAVSFFQIEQFADADRTLVRPLSTIRSGTLYLESLNGQERRLRPGQGLRFGSSVGEIRTLEVRDGRVGLRFHGRVRDMTSGAGDTRRSLMPTYLEWLQARHGLSLLWGTTLYVFGLAMAALRWWRTPA
jgi:hypothetical protein